MEWRLFLIRSFKVDSTTLMIYHSEQRWYYALLKWQFAVGFQRLFNMLKKVWTFKIFLYCCSYKCTLTATIFWFFFHIVIVYLMEHAIVLVWAVYFFTRKIIRQANKVSTVILIKLMGRNSFLELSNFLELLQYFMQWTIWKCKTFKTELKPVAIWNFRI